MSDEMAGTNGIHPEAEDAEDEEEEEVEVVSLVDEEGLESDYFLHEVLEMDEQRFYVLESTADADEVIILKLENELLVSPEEGELERVIAMLEEEWEVEDEDDDEEDGEEA